MWVQIPLPVPYQGTNLDTKIVSHFGGAIFVSVPKKPDIMGFSALLSILGEKLKARASSNSPLPKPWQTAYSLL